MSSRLYFSEENINFIVSTNIDIAATFPIVDHVNIECYGPGDILVQLTAATGAMGPTIRIKSGQTKRFELSDDQISQVRMGHTGTDSGYQVTAFKFMRVLYCKNFPKCSSSRQQK